LKIITRREDPVTRSAVGALGGFDGIHRGHQMIIAEAKKLAGGKKPVGLITFTPLPGSALKSNHPMYLTTDPEKESILKDLGLDFIFYFAFTREFARHSPRDFVRMMTERIAPSAVVVGQNFHFGRDRKGNAALLSALAGESFQVHIKDALDDEGVISSTRIRELLLLGNVLVAQRLLGRPYSMTGPVGYGKKAGQKLGFPTVNILAPPEKILPLDGVYRGRVAWDRQTHPGAVFCSHRLIEVHILDFRQDLYGRVLTVEFLDRLREVVRFPDADALKKAITADVARIRGDQ
jgi:riboflavin kinase/FMN adenylyltransferase